MKNGLKEATVALADIYRFNTGMQNTGNLTSLVNQIEKKINLVETSLGEVKSSLGRYKRYTREYARDDRRSFTSLS